ncbi:oligosaccharide flippase family protein, partial [Rubrolithibacter danxiaensis]|uniref:oligosaccharide flippase family protein n=1 Tax=Rubrolithibacter danxiaensis TaxID=3390805 RepID=UPI003BF7A31E
ISNIFSLYLNNAVNYVLPLIIVPYLIKVLGIEYYGYYVFAFAMANYFRIFINFGFEITTSKYIIKFRNDAERRSQIFSFVLFWRVIFFIISFIIFLVALNFIPLAHKIGSLFFILNFFYVISSVINLNAYYYSFQEIKFSTVANAIGKSLYLICLLIFVKSKDDYLYVALFSSMSWIIPSLILFINGKKRYQLSLIKPKLGQDKVILSEAKNAFISDVSVSLYSTTNVFVMGLAVPASIVGVYGSLERVYAALTTLISSSNYLIYPRLIKYYEIGKDFFFSKLKSIEIGYFLFSLLVFSLFFVSKPIILGYIFNGKTEEYANIYLSIFLVAAIISPFGSLYTRCLLIQDRSLTLLKVTTIGFLVNFIVLISIIFLFKSFAIIPVCVLATQLYIFTVKRLLVKRES